MHKVEFNKIGTAEYGDFHMRGAASIIIKTKNPITAKQQRETL